MPKIQLLDMYVTKYGAETGLFGDWEVPYRFTNYIDEHMSVRTSAGLFDVSHMGRLILRGADVLPLIQYIYTKDLSKIKEGSMSGPTLALNEYARVKDDEMLYKVSDEEWIVVTNALARGNMMSYISQIIKEKGFRVQVEDLTEKYAMIAIQGPESPRLMDEIGGRWASDLKPLEFRVDDTLGNNRVFLVSRSGWTGEDGFEIWGDARTIAEIVEKLVERGARLAGLIARDSLRIEMGFVLGGHEYGEDPSTYPCAIALRYGMGAITWTKKGFVGEEALRKCRREGVEWIRYGLKMGKEAGRLFPRQGAGVFVDDVNIGWVTSSTYSPVLNRGIAMAYLKATHAILGEQVEVDIRGKRYPAKIVDFPFIEK